MPVRRLPLPPIVLGRAISLGIAVLVLCSCGTRTSSEQPIGEAYAGPIQLLLRADIAGRSAAAGTVSHGDRLDILETRRRFVRVRAKNGVEGWVDASLLLNAEQMEELAALSRHAMQLPSQGTATVFDASNVHSEPSRISPSFYQIPEDGSVEVVGHKVTPRVQVRAAVRPPARKQPPKKKSKSKAKQVEPLALPPPPTLPADWQAMSVPRAADLAAQAVQPVALEDWSLVRTQDGKAGWVLSRMLFMAIPDEVAQYAEGHRITAYLPLGQVNDGGNLKNNWVWTSASPGYRASEFDGFRVFAWSTRRHRYETAFLARNVIGYYPLELASIPGEAEKGFTVLIQDKDGNIQKRTYGFSGFRIRLLSTVPYRKPKDSAVLSQTSTSQPPGTSQSTEWWPRISAWVRQWFRR